MSTQSTDRTLERWVCGSIRWQKARGGQSGGTCPSYRFVSPRSSNALFGNVSSIHLHPGGTASVPSSHQSHMFNGKGWETMQMSLRLGQVDKTQHTSMTEHDQDVTGS